MREAVNACTHSQCLVSHGKVYSAGCLETPSPPTERLIKCGDEIGVVPTAVFRGEFVTCGTLAATHRKVKRSL
jgi:hypothetical protein